MKKINVYSPNLKQRQERRNNIINQYEGKNEYKLTVVPAIQHEIGSYGLWMTFHKIVAKEKSLDSDFFIFCEDDHIFTKEYSWDYLKTSIEKVSRLNADILSGGVSWFETSIQYDKNLFWLDMFNGAQFLVIFKRLYNRILSIGCNESYILDFKLSEISDSIFVMYPFISIQQGFGYSDATKGEKVVSVEQYFNSTAGQLCRLDKVRTFYLNNNNHE